jgi:hypothetical protein
MADPMTDRWPWYDIVQGPDLEQGDLIPRSPLARLPEGVTIDELRQAGQADVGPRVRVELANVVVMSQSCDLQQRRLAFVLVCRHHSPAEMQAAGVLKSGRQGLDALNSIRKGRQPMYHMLNRCDLPEHQHDVQVVDFRDPVGIPFDFACGYAESLGPRLRLLPPYREHLAQGFARFFMRVGLPTDIDLSR